MDFAALQYPYPSRRSVVYAKNGMVATDGWAEVSSVSAIELAKQWRTDRALQRLEALLLVADGESLLLLSGSGEVIEPDGDVAAIGSGGFYALAAARAMVKHTDLDAAAIAQEALSIAADICVYTNHNIKVEEIEQGNLQG